MRPKPNALKTKIVEKSWWKNTKSIWVLKHTLPSQQRPPGDHLCFLHQRGCRPPCEILMRKILFKCRSTGCYILTFGWIGRRVTFSTDRGWMRKGGKHKAPRSALSPWEKIPMKFCFDQFVNKHWAMPFKYSAILAIVLQYTFLTYFAN